MPHVPAPEPQASIVSFPDGRPRPKLLDQVRQTIRTRHYSRRTEEAYVHWIRRYIVFHGKKHPSTLSVGDISSFLTWLAVERQVSASTQNQALSAVLFLYKAVLAIEIGPVPAVVRARTPERLPVVLSREEIGALLKQLTGTMRLIVMMTLVRDPLAGRRVRHSDGAGTARASGRLDNDDLLARDAARRPGREESDGSAVKWIRASVARIQGSPILLVRLELPAPERVTAMRPQGPSGNS